MKRIMSPKFLLTICLSALLFSCGSESLDDAAPEGVENPDGTTNPDQDPDKPIPDPDPDEEVSDTPCDFDLKNLQPTGDPIVINCLIDLNGETIDLPPGISFESDKGLITNGTLNFSGGVIDGLLLNSELTLTGDVTLKDETFKFLPSRWKNIVQGKTTKEIALNNNKNFEALINYTKSLGAKTFAVDVFDAYFEITTVTSTTADQNFYPSIEAINVPSDFTLQMTDNTYLRVQPNTRKNYTLLALREVSNAKVIGGNLYGDRMEHDDNSEPGPHAFGIVLMVHGSNNIDIEGVKMAYGTGDGGNVNSLNFTFQPNYVPSNNIRFTNCVFDSNRRNNVSITDGFDITVQGCEFINAGIDLPGSPGKAPGVALDVEAFRGKDDNGDFILYERAYNIIIKDNTEWGSKFGSFVIAIGEDVTIENNTTEDGIAIGAGHGVIIRGNTIVAAADDNIGAGITTGHPESRDTFNNVIANNKIIGHNIGIAAYQRDTKIFGNTIEDFSVGIQPKDIKNYEIYENTLTSDRQASIAIFGNLTTMDNVTFRNNNIVKVGREGFKMVAVNEGAEAAAFKTTITDNDFAHSITISRTNGVDFTQNRTKEGLIMVNANNINVNNNTIDASGRDAIIIQEGCSNLNFALNTITVTGAANLDCIDVRVPGTNIVIAENNACTNL